MIEPSVRLRRAIHLKDALLVKRIVQTNPQLLKNPDYEHKSNSSLHLAAELGLVDIVQVLLDAGHDNHEISQNTEWATPLMLAAESGSVEVGKLLISRCARSIPWTDRRGMDALSIAASRPASTALIPLLLSHPRHPSSVHHRDHQGNTPLHHASAAGSLKALRLLLEAGADPNARNTSAWTPIAYSLTVQAEVYFKQLISEFDPSSSTKRSGPGTPSSSTTISRTVTNETDTSSSSYHSPQRDRGDSNSSQPVLQHHGSRAELLKRKPGVRLVTAEDAGENRPASADAVSFNSTPRRVHASSNAAGTVRPGHFEAGRTRSATGEISRPGTSS